MKYIHSKEYFIIWSKNIALQHSEMAYKLNMKPIHAGFILFLHNKEQSVYGSSFSLKMNSSDFILPEELYTGTTSNEYKDDLLISNNPSFIELFAEKVYKAEWMFSKEDGAWYPGIPNINFNARLLLE